ncbi:hypothetical protein [Oceanithermus sp.]|uniref:hypothetical protein n=1 Tax=Oceanithermus sp. TaxID=2268145 RepID=UPI00257E5DBD|nr:hypothetical protein [Oceanithermus sp.]
MAGPKRPKWLTPELEAAARAYLEANPGHGPQYLKNHLATIGHELTYYRSRELYHLVTAYTPEGMPAPAPKRPPEPPKVQEPKRPDVRFEETATGNATLAYKGERPLSLEDVLQIAKVDTDVWEVERYVVNTWEMGRAKTKKSLEWEDSRMSGIIEDEGEIKKAPLWQIKVWLRRKRDVDLKAIFEGLIEDLAARAVPRPKGQSPVRVRRLERNSGYLAEISVYDLHVGKLAAAEETGNAYDTKRAIAVWKEAVEYLLEQAALYPLDEIVIPLGNDLFHIDTLDNTTTKGTRVDVDTRWQTAFRRVVDLLITDLIDRARAIAPVRLLMVPGNHDHQRTFYLGEVLRAYYRATEDVHVDNGATPRKYLRWGRVLIGYTHGNEEKHRDLPLIMANERPEDWSQTRYREWHVGHLHRKSEAAFQPLAENGGVRVRVLPSLSATDAWHHKKGFIANLRSAEAHVYHRERGYVAMFPFFADGDGLEPRKETA